MEHRVFENCALLCYYATNNFLPTFRDNLVLKRRLEISTTLPTGVFGKVERTRFHYAHRLKSRRCFLPADNRTISFRMVTEG
jgi:hypothetical protein